MTTRKRMMGLGVFACACLAILAWQWVGADSNVSYRTAQVVRGDLTVTVSATGNPNAVVTVQVGSQVSGNIQALYADFNTRVTKGELIATIDPAPFQTRVSQARGNLDAANATVANSEAVVAQAHANIEAATSALAAVRANVVKADALIDDAKAKVDRRVVMLSENAISSEDLESARTTYKAATADRDALAAQQQSADDAIAVAQAQLVVAQSQLAANQSQVKALTAALESAEIDLNHTKIQAPVDGVVVSRNVDVGQTVAASLAAPTLFLIAQDLTKMQVDTNVSEADIGRVRVGQPATFTVEAYPGMTFAGTVTSIREAPINVQNVITYDAVIGVENHDLLLFPGMTANVKIRVMDLPRALEVPNAALRYHPTGRTPAADAETAQHTGPSKAVWMLKDGIPQPVLISTGETDGTFSEVTAGKLKPGDQVIVAAQQKTATAGPGTAGLRAGGRGPGF